MKIPLITVNDIKSPLKSLLKGHFNITILLNMQAGEFVKGQLARVRIIIALRCSFVSFLGKYQCCNTD
jgi:hypothetical protein